MHNQEKWNQETRVYIINEPKQKIQPTSYPKQPLPTRITIISLHANQLHIKSKRRIKGVVEQKQKIYNHIPNNPLSSINLPYTMHIIKWTKMPFNDCLSLFKQQPTKNQI